MNIVEEVKKSEYILSFGAFLSADDAQVSEAIIEAIAKNSAEFVYMHPMDDSNMKVYYSQFIKYEVGSEEGIATMLLEAFVKESNETIQSFIDDLDIGYISAESSAGEEEIEEIFEKSQGKSNKLMIVGDDILTHENMHQIVSILALIQKYSDLKIIALDQGLQILIDTAMNEELTEVDDLKSYNGTVVYSYLSQEPSEEIVGSASFARVAKIADQDEVKFLINQEEVRRKFVIDKNLQGTIALCAVRLEDQTPLRSGYRYKQVKIEKVECNE